MFFSNIILFQKVNKLESKMAEKKIRKYDAWWKGKEDVDLGKERAGWHILKM